MGPRRKAREYALQMLFQWDITHDSVDQILSTFFNGQDESEAVADFARTLVIRTVENVEKIDILIQRHAEHWRLDRMATVDRNLLRLATQELFDNETPKTVVINEAIEIARRFSSQESPQFINGILDSIKKELEG